MQYSVRTNTILIYVKFNIQLGQIQQYVKKKILYQVMTNRIYCSDKYYIQLGQIQSAEIWVNFGFTTNVTEKQQQQQEQLVI